MRISVIKRTGQKEDFEKQKIIKVVKAAGLTQQKSEELADTIEKWLISQKKHSISSLSIRDKVLEELKKTDDYAAGLFEWYQTTKENKPLSENS